MNAIIGSSRKVQTNQVFFIRLGRGGEWANECIEQGVIKLSFNSVPEAFCVNKTWDRIREEIYPDLAPGTVTNFINQIRHFYESDEKILWITFHDNRLWWCFAHPQVEPQEDGTRIRQVIGQWQCININNEPLLLDRLSSFLTSIQNFRGTICQLSEEKRSYLLGKINDETLPEIEATEEAFKNLNDSLLHLIKFIDQDDMEILADLIFRHSGLQRISKVGEVLKGFDFICVSPLTNEKIGVQVKTKGQKNEFKAFLDFTKNLEDFKTFYFISQANDFDIKEFISSDTETTLLQERYQIKEARDLCQLICDAGLVTWVIERAALKGLGKK